MKSLFKKGIFTLAFIFVFMVFGINNVYASDWDSNNSLPNIESNYKLTTDVIINSTWQVPNGATTIDFNGVIIIIEKT